MSVLLATACQFFRDYDITVSYRDGAWSATYDPRDGHAPIVVLMPTLCALYDTMRAIVLADLALLGLPGWLTVDTSV